MSSNTNSFIAQYCAAKGETWDTISLADMQAVLRQGKSSLYSYTRTSETRTVEDDDPAAVGQAAEDQGGQHEDEQHREHE